MESGLPEMPGAKIVQIDPNLPKWEFNVRLADGTNGMLCLSTNGFVKTKDGPWAQLIYPSSACALDGHTVLIRPFADKSPLSIEFPTVDPEHAHALYTVIVHIMNIVCQAK
jgi:hypothetical protein